MGATGVGRLRAAFLQRGRDVGACRPRRHDAERESGGHRQPEREGQHPAVERDLARPGRQQAGERHQQVEARPGEHQSEHAPNEGQQRGLGEQLRQETSATGAERRPERQFPLASQHPGQREVGDIGAGDQQHQGSGAQQNQQHRTGVAGQLLAERRGDGGVAGVGLIDLGEVLLEPAGHRGQVGAELLDGHPGPQPAERGHAPEGGAVLVHACFAARPERTGRRRHVDVVVSWILRDRGQHPDHRVGLVVHLEHGAHDVWVATEALLPVGVAQHQHRFGAQVVVGVDERAAEQRLHAKHGEKVGRHHPGQHPVRLTAVQERERHAVILDEAVQRLQLVAVVDDLLDRERNVLGAGAGCLLAREHQLVPVAVGQRLQQHAVDNAEDRGVGADAERQGHDHQQAVARAAPQRADAVSDVLGEAVPNARPVAGRRLCVTHARIISCTTGREQSRVCAG